ncbi:MAG: methyltransferase domain-containing protein [Deltaproteobacteria bacterium]
MSVSSQSAIRGTVKWLHRYFFGSRPGYWAAAAFCRLMKHSVFSARTRALVDFDLMRMKARVGMPKRPVQPFQTKLHLGCGKRIVSGWLNVDVVNSDCQVDLAAGRLPWPDAVFESIICQHVVEHLELFSEGLPLLRELRRVSKPNAEIWLSCPDMEKVCKAYLLDKGATLRAEFEREFPQLAEWKALPSQMINSLFHQEGEHKNLFDFELLAWACHKAGFIDCSRVTEADLLKRFPEFPARNDGNHTLYIRAVCPEEECVESSKNRMGLCAVTYV